VWLAGVALLHNQRQLSRPNRQNKQNRQTPMYQNGNANRAMSTTFSMIDNQ